MKRQTIPFALALALALAATFTGGAAAATARGTRHHGRAHAPQRTRRAALPELNPKDHPSSTDVYSVAPCRDGCVTARFDFDLAWPGPHESVYRCPANSGNTAAAPFAAAFAGGFGTWAPGQCVARSYTPPVNRGPQPAAYSGSFVPACPAAVFCACGAARTKVVQFVDTRGKGMSAEDASAQHWAALHPRFTRTTGFTKGTKLVYEHPDGTRASRSISLRWVSTRFRLALRMHTS